MNDAEHQTEGLGDTFPRREGAESVSSLHEGELLLDRFKLVRLVGRGGMGEVYEARDLRLHTTVALKTVRASAASVEGLLERLRREVQLARGVTHPNVCRVFDFHEGPGPEGKPVAFVTMEFLDGETLAERLRAGGPFTPRDALPLLEQMAEGLASIHARRLVHRDFKPGNVMLVRTENQVRAVVTDLGIARVVGGGEADTGWLGTEAGAVVGSPAYMAPEQRRGAEVTARSDVHALALVACEMVSGQRPLESGVLKGVPRAWASALGRGLDPDPERRPADPRALVATLEGRKRRRRWVEAALALAVLLLLTGGAMAWRRSATSTLADRRSIAVLPLANLGGSPDDDYFGEGLAEDINTQLTKVRALHVVSRASTRPLKGTTRPVREIAQELGVGTLLEGTIRRAGGRMRITAQLVDARTDHQLWAETYDRDIRDVLDVQTDVASKVAEALALQLTAAEGERLHHGATSSPEAYDSYLRGIAKADEVWDAKAMRAAITDFERAVAIDPGYALAHAQLGMEYILYGLYIDASQHSWVEKGRAEVARALELEPELAVPHLALGRLLFSRQGGWNLEGAMRELQRAEEIEPDSAHLDRSNVALHAGLETLGIREAEAALKLNPRSTAARRQVTTAYAFSGRWSDALARYPNPDLASDPYVLVDSFLRVGRLSEVLKFVFAPSPDGDFLPDPPDPIMALTLALAGKKEEAAFLVSFFEKGFPVWAGESGHHDLHMLACTEALLGHPQEAVAWLRKASHAGLPNYLLFSRDPLLDPIRSDPGFIQFMAELKPRWEQWTREYR